jgi:hypothetical protein
MKNNNFYICVHTVQKYQTGLNVCVEVGAIASSVVVMAVLLRSSNSRML